MGSTTTDVSCMGGSRPPTTVDINNPHHFSPGKKSLIVVIGIVIGLNANIGSSLPSGAAASIADHFSVRSSIQLVLLNSIYLLGYAFGPVVFGPLSEHVGRRPVLLGTCGAYLIFTICCAVSPLYEILLLFRFLAGVAAAAPIAIIGPLYADIYNDPEKRGHAVAYFTCTGVAAASAGPLISGYAGLYSWNLSFWIGAAMSGASLPFVAFLPETYAPVINRKLSPSRPQSGSVAMRFLREMKVVLSKPFTMFVKEPIVLFTSLYCAYLYAMFFLFFQAYPIIFRGVFEMPPEEVGLTFLPIAVGCLLGIVPYLAYSSYHRQASLSGQSWASQDEYRRLPLACLGGPIPQLTHTFNPSIVGTLFWLGWTAYPSFHPAVPIMSGLAFGVGYLMIFIAMFNYLNDAYRQYAAPAHAAASTTRSLIAVCLPLAAPQMYNDLGVQWACSLLGFLVLALSLIPFAFIKYGKAIRSRSPLAQKILLESNEASQPEMVDA